MKLAVMQPCYLPWRGYFALMKLADVFVHFDDVPLPLGRTYQSRVAIKTAQGRRWLSVPVKRIAHQLINQVELVDDGWRSKHIKTLQQELPTSVGLVRPLLERPWNRLCELNIELAAAVSAALRIRTETMRSTQLRAAGCGWQKILNICQVLGATHYITGHGARNYFDHHAFEDAGIAVSYLDYDLEPYPQPHGEFDPYVTALDLINNSDQPESLVGARLVSWREFLNRPDPAARSALPLDASEVFRP